MNTDKTSQKNPVEVSEEPVKEEDVKFTPEQQKMLQRIFFQKFPTKHRACRFPGENDKDFKHRKNVMKRKRRALRGKK